MAGLLAAFAVLLGASPGSQAGIAWVPVGQAPTLRVDQPADLVLTWNAGLDSLMSDSGFEAGLTNAWRVETKSGTGFTLNYPGAPGLGGIPLLAGTRSVCLMGARSLGSNGAISQEVTLPAEATSAVISWLVWTDDASATTARELRVEARDLSDHLLGVAFLGNQSALPFRTTWRLSADLSPFLGRTIRVAFVGTVGHAGRIVLDDIRLQAAPMPGVEFEVYFAAGSSINATNLVGRSPNLSWRLENLKPQLPYAWQVVTVRGEERIAGPVWRFRTATRSTLDHYEIEPIASPQVLAEPFSFAIAARDAHNFTPTDAPAAGSAALDLVAIAHERVAPTVVISEIGVTTGFKYTNAVEFANVASEPVDVSGWQIALYDDQAYRSPRARFTLPGGTSVAPGALFTLSCVSQGPGAFPSFRLGSNVGWTTSFSSSRIGVALLDAATNLVDFVNANGVDPFNVTNPVPVLPDHWLGSGIGSVQSTLQAYQRTGPVDEQSAFGWVQVTNSIGAWNVGLNAPFARARGRLPLDRACLTNTLAGLWQGNLTGLAPGTNVTLAVRDSKGRSGLSVPFALKDQPVVGIELADGPWREGESQAPYRGLARLRHAEATDLVIELSASPPNTLILPPTLTIPAGSMTGEFSIGTLDDSALTGPRTVTVGGTSPGFEVLPATGLLIDDETARLALAFPVWIDEGATQSATLTLGTVIQQPLVVALRCSDSAVLQVPTQVTIPPGVSAIEFPVTAVEDDIVTGPQTVQVIAEVPGWPTASAGAEVRDNEPRTVTLTLPGLVAEGAGANNTGTLRLAGRANADVIVRLTSSDLTEIEVPESVIVKAGDNSVAVPLTIVDDTEKDGTQPVRVQATVTGFGSADSIVNVADNDPHHFVVDVASDPKFAGMSFGVTVTAFDVNGEWVTAFGASAALSAQGTAGALDLNVSSTGSFGGGRWSGALAISQADESARIVVERDGAQGESLPFRVLPSPIFKQYSMAVADMVWDPALGRLLVSVAETDLDHANQVVVIDPETGALASLFEAGRIQRLSAVENPGEGRLALSADGRTLYIGTDGASVVRQFDLGTGASVRQFAVGANELGETQILFDLQVVPSDPERLVLARTDGANRGGLAEYRAGTMLPGRGAYSSHVMVSPDGTEGYSYMGRWLGDLLFHYQLTDSGITGTEILPKAGLWFGGDVRLHEGLIYFSSGHVYDPTTKSWRGRYPLVGAVNQYDNQGRFEFSADGQWVWYVSGAGQDGQVLEAFARDTFQCVRRLSLETIPGTVCRLWECGPRWLALHNGSSVYLLQSPLLQPVGDRADLALGYRVQSPFAATRQPFTYTVAVTNTGPAVALDVLLDDRLPSGVEFVSASLTQGRWEGSGSWGRAVFGDLPVGAVAEARITVRPLVGGWFTNDLVAVANTWDNAPGNNRSQPATSVRLGLGPDDIGLIPLGAQALAYDPTRRRLYASVGSDGSGWASRVVSIEAETGAIVGSYDVGRTPGRMAVSSDGHFLYVAVEDNRAVCRLDLNTGAPDLYFVLGRTADNWLLTVADLVPFPGRPHSVAVPMTMTLEGTGSGGGGIAIYDDAERRTDVGLNGDYVAASFFRFDETGSMIFGANILNSALEYFTVSGRGTTFANRVGLVGSSGTLALDYAHGLLYCSDGRVIDALATNVAGFTAVANGDQRVAVHPGAGRLCYARWPGAVLDIFDEATRQPLGTVSLTGVDDFIGEILPVGEDRLALRLYKGTIFMVRSSLLLGPNADLDGDGMADVWEAQHGLDRTNPADAGLDADGDGLSNLGESTAGTDPQDRESVLRLEALAATSGEVHLQFLAAAHRAYTIWQTGDLAGGDWSRWLEVPATDTTRSVVVPHAATTGSPVFWRVGTMLPDLH